MTQSITSGDKVEHFKTVIFTAEPSTGYQVKEWKVDGNVVPDETGLTYTIASLEGAVTVTVEFEKTTFTVTFKDWDGRVLDTQEVEPGGSATAPDEPEREGYTFKGWDKDFTDVTGNLTVTATYTLSSIEDLNNLTLAADAMVRPAYTTGIAEWNTYWGNLQTKLQEAKVVYDQLKGKDVLTSEETTQLAKAKADLQTAMEIIEGIEDFDASLGGRESPLGLVETVYNRSLISDGFQYGRLRCFYDKEGQRPILAVVRVLTSTRLLSRYNRDRHEPGSAKCNGIRIYCPPAIR
jgi:uncharacterized repeat protein (TIGR02543 family)